MFGFKEKEYALIVKALKKFPEIESAKIFWESCAWEL